MKGFIRVNDEQVLFWHKYTRDANIIEQGHIADLTLSGEANPWYDTKGNPHKFKSIPKAIMFAEDSLVNDGCNDIEYIDDRIVD